VHSSVGKVMHNSTFNYSFLINIIIKVTSTNFTTYDLQNEEVLYM